VDVEPDGGQESCLVPAPSAGYLEDVLRLHVAGYATTTLFHKTLASLNLF
jgi:hypothetical protein